MSNSADLFQQALKLHQTGKLREAEPLYREVLSAAPAHLPAWGNLGNVLRELGQLDQAAECYRRILAHQPDAAQAHNDLGIVALRQRKFVEAGEAFQQAINCDPTFAEAFRNLGALCVRFRKHDEAALCYRRVVELQPELAEGHVNLGAVLVQQGKFDEAVACCRRAVELAPQHAGAYNNLGTALRRQNRPGHVTESEACWRKAIALNPNFAEAYNNLGVALAEQDQVEEATACYARAVELQPNYFEAIGNLGYVLVAQGRLADAEKFCRSTLAMNATHAESHCNLAFVLAESGRWEEAEACCRRALELNPSHPQSHYNLGKALEQTGRHGEALTHFERCLSFEPNNVDAHYANGTTLLAMGKFAEAWPHFEWRSLRKDLQLPHRELPRWNGSPPVGRTILLRAEKRLSDTLQFIRYAEPLKQLGAHVIVECPPTLEHLLARCAGVDQVVPTGAAVEGVDVQVPMLGLPAIFRTTLTTVPAKVPYLFADAGAQAQWKHQLSASSGLRVGVAWQGRPAGSRDRARSFPLTELAPLVSISGVQLYSLQFGAGSEQLHADGAPGGIIDFGDRLGDIDNTAALVANLDLVISCDSAPAHLAGGLGVPVWLALPSAADWRWLLDRSDSPWYPTMRLFRQRRAGDWTAVFREIGEQLGKLVAGR